MEGGRGSMVVNAWSVGWGWWASLSGGCMGLVAIGQSEWRVGGAGGPV